MSLNLILVKIVRNCVVSLHKEAMAGLLNHLGLDRDLVLGNFYL